MIISPGLFIMIPGKTEGWPGPPQLLIPDPVTVTRVTSQSEARTGGPGPIRGQQTVSHDQGQTTGASHHWFILIPGDRKPWQYFIPLTLSLFATVLRFGGCCVSVDPSNGLYNTQQWGDHCDLWAHNAAISIVPSKKRDFFSDIKIPVKIRNRCEAILGDLLHLTTTLLSVSQYCDYV